MFFPGCFLLGIPTFAPLQTHCLQNVYRMNTRFTELAWPSGGGHLIAKVHVVQDLSLAIRLLKHREGPVAQEMVRLPTEEPVPTPTAHTTPLPAAQQNRGQLSLRFRVFQHTK